jgi:hypothetical protein
MGYYVVRTTNTETQSFAVKANSKIEAAELVNANDKTRVRQIGDEANGNIETIEVDAAAWASAIKTKKK